MSWCCVCGYSRHLRSPEWKWRKASWQGHSWQPQKSACAFAPQRLQLASYKSHLSLSLLIFTSFHTSKRRAPMKGPDSRSFLTESINRRVPGVPLISGESPVTTTVCRAVGSPRGWAAEGECMCSPHGECCVPHDKAAFLTRSGEAAALCLCERLKEKRLSAVNRALSPAQLFCKWIRSTEILPWIPWGSNRHR